MYEDFKKRMELRGSYMGEVMRRQSDYVVDSTWMNSVSTRPVCVKVIDRGLPPTYESAEDFDEVLWAHFESNSKYNISKDDVDYYLTFRPGEMLRHPEIKIGAYVCIPNVDNVLEWWMIAYIDNDNELRKTHILKTNWTFKWITDGKIYQCLGCQRYASSCNSGAFIQDRTTKAENMDGIWLPTNLDSDTLGYNQRIMISAGNRSTPICWEITKVETTIPVGLTKFTVSQTPFDPEHDNSDIGLCDYYKSEITPSPSNPEQETIPAATIKYNGAKPTVKVGGSYKVFTPTFSSPTTTVQQWTIKDKNGYITTDTNYTIEYSGQQLKLKVSQNYNLIGTVLTVKVIGSDDSTAELKVEVV